MTETIFTPNAALRILFVDNSRTTRAAMVRMLEEKGYEATATGTGNEAIEMVKTGAFDIIIMDLYMPLMNGHEAARLIRAFPEESLKNIPIIALTASSDEKDREVAKSAGMNDFVVKNIDQIELFTLLEKYHKK
ncbi:MAG: sensor histidine kinase/response regulator [Francisellaceae bacterium]|nr:sensor histidine kinase/response regulator [Francisellaceae bacterium]